MSANPSPRRPPPYPRPTLARVYRLRVLRMRRVANQHGGRDVARQTGRYARLVVLSTFAGAQK